MENQGLLSYLQRSLVMVMNEVTLNQAPTSNSLFAGDPDFIISLLVDSIERVLQSGRKGTLPLVAQLRERPRREISAPNDFVPPFSAFFRAKLLVSYFSELFRSLF